MCWENHAALASFDVTWDWGQREQAYTEVKLPCRKGRDGPCPRELPKSLCPQTTTILVTLGSQMLARGLGGLSNQLRFFFSFSSDSPDYPLIHSAGQTHLNLPVCASLLRTGYAPASPAALGLPLCSHFSFQISLRELDGDGGHVGIF